MLTAWDRTPLLYSRIKHSFIFKKKTTKKQTHTQQICLQKVSFEVDGWIPVRVSPALGSYH